jgi:Family of unknown function (DUF6941)
MAIPPVLLGTLVCRNVVRDPDTHKYHLLGVSDFFAFPNLPASTEFTLFLSLTEVNGSYNLEVRVVEVDEEDDLVFRTTGRLESNDPIAVLQFPFPAFTLEFVKEGEYRLQFLVDGEIITERKLTVRERGGESDGQ